MGVSFSSTPNLCDAKIPVKELSTGQISSLTPYLAPWACPKAWSQPEHIVQDGTELSFFYRANTSNQQLVKTVHKSCSIG